MARPARTRQTLYQHACCGLPSAGLAIMQDASTRPHGEHSGHYMWDMSCGKSYEQESTAHCVACSCTYTHDHILYPFQQVVVTLEGHWMLGNNTTLYTYTSYNHISAGLPLTSAHVDRQLTEATPHPTGVGPVSQSSPRTQRNCPESSFIRSAAIPHSSDNCFPRRDDHEPSRVCTYANGPSPVPCSSHRYLSMLKRLLRATFDPPPPLPPAHAPT